MVLLTIISVAGVSLVSLIGLFTLSLTKARLRKIASVFISFAVGALLGDSFIHLIPETFSQADPPLRSSLLILAGMMIFFVVEKLLRHRHGILHDHHHPGAVRHPELATINVLGDALHNFIDGVLIGVSYLASPTLGFSTTIAVLFHEIPQEFGDFGILVHSGLSVRNAVLLNLASASTSILGAVLALIAGSVAQETVVLFLLPVAAGGFVYLAAADLIPELQHDRSLRGLVSQTSLMSLGMGLMAVLAIIE